MLRLLYKSKFKKYHSVVFAELPKRNPVAVVKNTKQLRPRSACYTLQAIGMTPNSKGSPTPLAKPTTRRQSQVVDQEAMSVDVVESAIVQRLNDSLDMAVSRAERLYYNCNYMECYKLTEAILKRDPYHSGCLPIHISCQVELKQSNS